MSNNRYATTVRTDSLTILSGQTESGLFTCNGMQLRAIAFPANWTSGSVSFKVSLDGSSTEYNLKNVDGSSLSIASIASDYISMLPYVNDSVPYIKISCSVAQAQNVNLILVFQPLFQGIHA